MEIKRIYDNLAQYIKQNKVLVMYGPRRVGKTFLLNRFMKQAELKFRYALGDDIIVQDILGSQNIDSLKTYLDGFNLLIVDEAQLVPHVGSGLKIIVDTIPGISVIATGSASFDLSNKVGEPLTGRQNILCLYPVSQLELSTQMNACDLSRRLNKYLIYGSYPEVLTLDSHTDKAAYLTTTSNSYLLKDILALENVKGSKVLLGLLRLLAFQIGKEVSLTELGERLNLDKKTVARYLDLLEKSFILINLRGFSRNLRKEVSKKSKYFFYDNGIRNAIISNFNDLELRDDIGMLWENFLVAERIKFQAYTNLYTNNYFWRTWDQDEVDFVEERGGKLFGYEFKWSDKKKVKIPHKWLDTYPESTFEVITPTNYLEYVAGSKQF